MREAASFLAPGNGRPLCGLAVLAMAIFAIALGITAQAAGIIQSEAQRQSRCS